MATADALNADVLRPRLDIAAYRGPEIFNSIYDSLRKWGSIIHPNGMSLYLATVPAGVLLHHGNTRNATPTKPDWLAYEIEHAEIFARVRRPRGRPGHPKKDELDVDPLHHTQKVLSEVQHRKENAVATYPDTETGHGWLHTYRTTQTLPMLYIDGMSGDKGDSGVIDTQDYLLRGLSHSRAEEETQRDVDDTLPPGPPGEYDRALDLCEICADWGLQGVVRTEGAGFEIIKCNFSDGLEQVSSVQRVDPSRNEGGRGPGNHDRNRKDRYVEVGSRRTVLDYSSMVSAFFFPVNLTNPDWNQSDLPRLSNADPKDLEYMRQYLAQVVATRRGLSMSPFNQRDVADLIVRRYSTRLSSMIDDTSSIEDVADHCHFLLEAFIDYSVEDDEHRDAEGRVRCSTFYLQTMPRDTEIDRLIYAAFKAVNSEICTTLFAIRSLVAEPTTDKDEVLSGIKESLKLLRQYLSWNVFQ